MAGRIARSGICLLLAWPFAIGADSTPPTAPENLVAIPTSSSEIRLSWDPATDDRRVRKYEVSRDGVVIARPPKTAYVDRKLSPQTTYRYEVVASDGINVSPIASFTVSTPVVGATAEASRATRPGKGGGKPDKENPGKGKPDKGEPGGDGPEPPVGVPEGWRVSFGDDFDGSGSIDTTGETRNWRFEDIDDGLHRSGNSGINRDGTVLANGGSANGKRWSAWYDAHHDRNAYRADGILELGGHVSGEIDPTRPEPYYDDGLFTDFGSSKLYSVWLDTFARTYVGGELGHVMDPDSPGKLFKYGFIEARVSFEQIVTPGFRFSIWLMPGANDAEGQDLVVSDAYDADGNNGVEIDMFEYEWLNDAYRNRLHMALIGGAAGSSARTFDTSYVADLHTGFHTVGLLWTADRLEWSLNGIPVHEVTDPDLIPDVYSYLIMSREMNSGVKRLGLDTVEDGEAVELLPYRPRDFGLYATNVWAFRDSIDADKARVNHIRVWQP